MQLLTDSLTTVAPPTFTTSWPLQVPFALALPVNVAFTVSPVVVLPVQVTVPEADLPSALALRSAVQSGPLESVTPASFSEAVIADSTALSSAVSRAASAWPDGVAVELGRPRVGLAGVAGVAAGGGVGVTDAAGGFDVITGVVGLETGAAWPPHPLNRTNVPAAARPRRSTGRR